MQGIIQTTFLTSKAGNQIEECEDALSVVPIKTIERSKTFYVSIADGATESSFAKEWAHILTEGFASFSFPYDIGLLKELENLQGKLSQLFGKLDLPWYAEEKMRKGAFAAFLGVQFNVHRNRYFGIVIGDCCLFQIRNDALINSFPYSLSDSFTISPYLISSNPQCNTNLPEEITSFYGSIEKQDIFIFLSDAVAQWFLQRFENNERPWEYLQKAISNVPTEVINLNLLELISDQREKKLMKNDDVVIVVIGFSE